MIDRTGSISDKKATNRRIRKRVVSKMNTTKDRIRANVREMSIQYDVFKTEFLSDNPGTGEALAWRAYVMWRVAELHTRQEELAGKTILPLQPDAGD